MIELTITPRFNYYSRRTWWFVEWPEGGKVSPAKEMSLLDIVYDEMAYTGTVGFCVQYFVDPLDHNTKSEYDLAVKENHNVMFVDDIYYHSCQGDSAEWIQRKHYEHIVGMAFRDKESAELFKYRIEVRYTFKALQASYE